jgi:two-component system chemotaxis response regulator CheB
MPRIRALVVDDSVTIRKVLSDTLSEEPDIEVVGSASNGQIALARLTQHNPDVVILDIEMPEMDGLTALARMRASHPKTPVIMFSSLTERGAKETLEALSLGAADYFAKPAGGLDESRQLIRNQLAPTIRALCAGEVARPAATWLEAAKPATPLPPRSKPAARVDVVAIGSSTGGPNALAEVFAALPSSLPVPILIVQHMPPVFTKILAERLTKNSKVPTAEAIHGEPLAAGKAYIAPGDFHLVADRQGTSLFTSLNQDSLENSCRPAADPLFRSIASLFGPHCLAVVLTGMGQDGLRGCEMIAAGGGQIIVQDEASSVVWGMPGAVARAGLADKVLPISLIGSEIVRRMGAGRG